MKIVDVDPASPLFGYVRPGYAIKSINGASVIDNIDFRYKMSEERVDIIFTDPDGSELDFQFDEPYGSDLGLTLADNKIRTCKNDCIFCFVSQQPQGMRRLLYVKDEDYRLSFTHGNFVTLSNTTDEDIERIIEQRLSPLYVSVHATDDKLRRCMLRNEKLKPIIPRLRLLTENGITVQTQVVLCPEVNDGKNLERTIDELAALAPGVETLAVVPVGLTKYREHLPNLRRYNADEAKAIVRYIESRQRELFNELGTRFVWPADEFYIAAGLPFATRASYEEMSQFENGIGMAREFVTNFNRRRKQFREVRSDRNALFLTGYSAQPFLSEDVFRWIEQETSLNATLQPVDNDFWGHGVTVSGLLTGQDMLKTARASSPEYDTVVLPPNCLNNDDLFLDNMTLDTFTRTLGRRVVIGQYDMAATLREVYQ
jgi:putative radical SAM enzyme (TIGR03279 family)